MQRKNRFSSLALLIICIALIVFNFNFYGNQFKKNNRLTIINWDVFGYYIYLPATIIYNDLAIENKIWLDEINSKYQVTPYYYQLAGGSKGKTRIIYQQGISYFFLPGFLIAHTIASHVGYPADGFSFPYQFSIIITSLLITFLGLFYLRKLLLSYFSDLLVACLMLIICFGTNWFLTVAYGHGMPHSFLFTLNILIAFTTKKWFETNEIRYVALTAFLIGWAFSCRPTEIILLLSPLLYNVDSFCAFKLKWKQQALSKNLHYFIAILLLSVFPLFVYMQYASNDILKFNLHTEQLCLLSPFTLDFLFSFKKGWLLYTPVMLFALAGFYFLFKRNLNLFWSLFIIIILQVWLASSWENWWYAASYSQRPMIDFYGLLAIPFGFLIMEVFKQKQTVWISFSVALTIIFGLSIFQSYQYYTGIIHNERMTKAYYLSTFGKSSVTPQQLNLLEPDRSATSYSGNIANLILKPLVVFKDILAANSKYLLTKDSSTFISLNPNQNEIVLFEKEHNKISDKKYFWLTGQAEVLLEDKNDLNNVFILIKTDAVKDRTIKQSKFLIQDKTPLPGGGYVLKFSYITPNFFHDNDKVIVLLSYTGKSQIKLSNFVGDVLIPKTDY